MKEDGEWKRKCSGERRMDRIARLKNPIQEYAWGSRTAIPSLMGLPVPSAKPAAELWLGAHPKAPSQVMVDGRWMALNQLMERDPVSMLGKRAAETFSNTLPFLFKVLAAEGPLSIQAHPNLEQAQAGFERESHLAIPLDAPERNYKDPHHKPEILCAVTRFEALEGFRPPGELLDLLGRVCSGTLTDELALLKRASDDLGIKQLFVSINAMDPSRRDRLIESAMLNARRYLDEDPAFGWMVELGRTYPGDMGVLSPLFLNLVVLEAGEALYIPAGQLHTYLKGVGVELMANSDNTVRGGLTPKHVDMPELLRIVDFSPSPVQKILPRPGAPAERVYETPAEEFQLSMITVSDGITFISQKDRSVEIMICIEGKARIQDLRIGASETLGKGQSVLIPAAAGPYQIEGEATLYRAMVGRRS